MEHWFQHKNPTGFLLCYTYDMEPTNPPDDIRNVPAQNPESKKKSLALILAIVAVVALILAVAAFLSPKLGEQDSAQDDTFGLPTFAELPPNLQNKPYFLKDSPAKKPADIQAIQYFHHDGAVYLGADPNNILPLPEADLETFQVLITNSELVKAGMVYAKDKNNVYTSNVIVPGADATTFVIVGNGLNAKDKNRAYVYGSIMENVDLPSFTATSNEIIKDKSALYCGMGDKRIEVPDSNALVLLARNKLVSLVGDTTSVYTDSCKVLEVTDSEGTLHHADPATLVVKGNFAYDATSVFFLGDPNTPFLMNNPALIEGADGATFKQTERTISDVITITAEDATMRYILRFDVAGAKTQFQNWQFSKEAKTN